MSPGDRDSGLGLAEVVAAFSLATDLGLGQPMEHVLRAWAIATRLGEHMGIESDNAAALYYVAMLAWVGCVADTPEVASWFGDDIAFRRDSYGVDFAGLPKFKFALSHVGTGSPTLRRLRLAGNLVMTGGKPIERGLMAHCLSTSLMAERFGLGDEVCEPLRQFFTRWDGSGVPGGVGGDDVAGSIRLFHLVDCVEVAHQSGGTAAAIELARARRGTQFDPNVVDAFCTLAADLFDELDEATDWPTLIASDPRLQQRLSEAGLDSALEAIADFTDLRSRSRTGHSRAVADLAARAGELSGLSKENVVILRRAALVHDVGMHGVPATILEKPGPLTSTESERMRMHSYYTERTLARPQALARIGAVASLANERLDGSGYHRGLSGSAIPVTARILAAACEFQAMTEPRAYRPARTPKAAASELRNDVRSGRLATDAVDAVFAAAGQQRPKRAAGPAGLTPREVEVLTLIARGASNKQVAQALDITFKTAGTHIERIYVKIGASTRSTATLFAMQNGLLDSFTPLDV
jgi:HD-GYP domain-containing protein (c-di-GMP phosphodiesterase class II)